MKVKVYDMLGKEAGEMELSDSIFAAQINVPLMHEMVKNYLANQRHGTQSTLTRSEVSGGGKKPWRQKGTGRARQGSTRSPQWTHGGIALGPKPRKYRYSVNKKAKRVAMKSALSAKVAEGNLIVLDTLAFDEIKTKNMVNVLKALNVAEKALVVMPTPDVTVIKSARNIEGVKTACVNTLNVYDIVKHDKFVITKEAVNKVEEVYN
ncbi:MAG: 50S ribosomal protein L4 [Clostridia bacterium]|nr:50S ribosomal protein L4 [Clostridia bacterium]MBO5213494.1 50S ribosomal protein L4 [Clostridia bacterium]